MIAQTFEVIVPFPVSVGIYRLTTDLEPVGTATTIHELRCEVSFFGPYEDACVSWLDAGVLQDLRLSIDELVRAEEMAIELGAVRLAALVNERKRMAS